MKDADIVTTNFASVYELLSYSSDMLPMGLILTS